ADTAANGTGLFTISGRGSLSTQAAHANITITAAGVFLRGLTMQGNGGSGPVGVRNFGGGAALGLGGTAGGCPIVSCGLGYHSAGTLTLGGTATSSIVVDDIAGAQSDSIGTVDLRATRPGGTVSFSNNDSTFNALTVTAAGGIDLGTGVTTDAGGQAYNSPVTL